MKEKIPVVAFLSAALVVIACALLLFESDLLWKIQEENLFLGSSLFLREQLVASGGLLSWLGAFFTQFFFHPWTGTIVLCLWWALLVWLTQRAFCLPRRWCVLLLVPVALLLLTIVDQGYWVYMLKLRGHAFAATIGTTAVAALLWGFRCIPSRACWRVTYILLTAAIGYPLLGIYGLAATLLMALWGWRLGGGWRQCVALTLVAVAAVVAVPLFCYHHVYYQTNLDNIWFTGLPIYYITEEYHAYYLPFYFLAAFYAAMAAGYRTECRQPEGAARPKTVWLRWLPQAGVAAVLAWGVVHFWYDDENFHHELAMQRSIDRLDWQAVVDEARRQDCEPTRAIVMMRNLALSRLGRQADEQFLFRNGSRPYAAPFDIRQMIVCGPLIYYHYGMLNYCNRLCTEMGVEFNWRVQQLKAMVKCAILSNETALARKYIALLRQTTFHGSWADRAEQLLRHPGQIAHDADMEPVTHMLHYTNLLTSDKGSPERFLMQQLAASTYTGDPLFQEQALLATLWTRDIRQFWDRFADYIRLHPRDRMPRYYQEAAYLYANIEGRDNIDSQPFDASVKESYSRFMQFAAQYDNAEIEVARKALYPAFGQTYYYDYYTMSQLPEY